MQRILSVEASRNVNEPNSEFVTKRFCCSFLLTVAFFAVLGGFLLGKFVSDRTLDDIIREMRELADTVATLNRNFQDHNLTVLADCNFSFIGNNRTGLLKAEEYVKRLNGCFNNG